MRPRGTGTGTAFEHDLLVLLRRLLPNCWIVHGSPSAEGDLIVIRDGTTAITIEAKVTHQRSLSVGNTGRLRVQYDRLLDGAMRYFPVYYCVSFREDGKPDDIRFFPVIPRRPPPYRREEGMRPLKWAARVSTPP